MDRLAQEDVEMGGVTDPTGSAALITPWRTPTETPIASSTPTGSTSEGLEQTDDSAQGPLCPQLLRKRPR